MNQSEGNNKLLLKDGNIIDGTGSPARPGSVLIIDGAIAEIGTFPPPEDVRVIDCAGLTISPGFIDVHSHSDLQILQSRKEKLLQGVTTEVVGNCGFSAYPVPPDRKLLYEFANGIFCGGDDWGWESARDYLHSTRNSTTTANVVSLVGHGSLRLAQMGFTSAPPSSENLRTMARVLDESLSMGAAGFSTGLMYAPGSSAGRDELEQLCRIVARHGKIYTTHMRSYASHLLQAIDEQIDLARRTGVRLEISHLQAAGRQNWSKQSQALERIEKARLEGIDVAFDCYPYTAGSTVLTQLLPQWALDGGLKGLLARLTNPSDRARIASATQAFDEGDWADIQITSLATEKNSSLVGKSVAAIAQDRNCDPVKAVLDLLLEEQGKVQIVCFSQDEENLRQLLTHPLSSVISDGFYVKGRAHPRLYGTFPVLLGKMCRERRWLDLPQAINKITDFPARRFAIPRRGRLERGFFADLTIFDPDVIDSGSTYLNPAVPPVGIKYVFRNGKQAVPDSDRT